MEASILLLADFANIDAVGKLNIIGAFNQIRVLNFPVMHQQMYLVVRLVAHLGELNRERNLKIILWDQDAIEKWATPDIPFEVKAPKGGKLSEYNAIISIQRMIFEEEGTYEFRVYVDQDQKGTIPIDVVLIEPQDSGEQ